ncbi:GNAT family N-acetyltransferase [Methylobacterium sp. Leaf118]|uniref:GNAT family N-acetyltransferase n=1 Tax=Methylobacterium sp. Leaf118 TaxID=2876562 RepID=UPI001E3195C9|nr:GNAT family N-acetyltransferase [Methylobacterium sp. Leaf118]
MPDNALASPAPVPSAESADRLLPSLLAAHARVQAGCYVSGVEAGPGGGQWLWSRHLAEFGLNMSVGVRDGAWIRAEAARRGRAPVALAADMGEARDLCLALGAAPVAAVAWMVRDLAPAEARTATEGGLTVSERPAPDAAFLGVMARQSDNPAVNAATMEGYGPALRAATAGPGIRVRHLTLWEGNAPVACASLHAEAAWAGLYNVAVAAPHQRRGLGRRITAQAIAAAAALGCAGLFLQCVPSGPVERLYAGLGFRRVARPLLLALR